MKIKAGDTVEILKAKELLEKSGKYEVKKR